MLFLPSVPHLFISILLILQKPHSTLAKYDTKSCNNSPHLCSLSYGAITHLGTHNSPFLRDSSTGYSTSGNQYFDVTTQLNAGIRLLQGQLHEDPDGGEPRLCHSTCSLMDAGPLSTWLSKVKSWLDSNPSDVVTLLIVNDDNINADRILPSFTKSNAAELAYTPSEGGIRKFPTLQSMIDDKKRLVIFVSSGVTSKNASFLLNEWAFLWETEWENKERDDWSCDLDRPTSLQGDDGIKKAESGGLVPLLNWFFYTDMGMSLLKPNDPTDGDVAKTNAALAIAVGKCAKSDGWQSLPSPRVPTFILVDFFNEGSPIQAVDALNNVTNPANRKDPPLSPTKKTMEGSTAGKSVAEVALDDLLYKVDTQGKNPSWSEWIIASGNWGKGVA